VKIVVTSLAAVVLLLAAAGCSDDSSDGTVPRPEPEFGTVAEGDAAVDDDAANDSDDGAATNDDGAATDDESLATDGTGEAVVGPTLQDHWHSAYAVHDCVSDSFLPPFDSDFDPAGIHSHGDSIIHIHPFVPEATGTGATLGVFFDAMGVTVTADAITLPDGEVLEAGVACDGQPSVIVVAMWDDGFDTSGTPSVVFDADFHDIVLDGERRAYTIARVAVGADIPPPGPEAIDNLAASYGIDRI
jgi:hypothetical protein